MPFYPHREDTREGEPRWTIIVEDLQDVWLMIPFTKQLHQQAHHPLSFVVQKTSIEGVKMGLEHDSLIMPERSIRFQKKFMKTIHVTGFASDELVEKLLSLTFGKG